MVDVPKSPVLEVPAWPVLKVAKVVYTKGGKAFAASRSAGLRHHAGIDILAPRGAVVVATEDGQIVATQRFNGPNAHAILLQTNSGPVILYGEVEPGSWREFGLKIGAWVKKGQPIARVGINPGGSTMLHFEAYKRGTTTNHRWYQNQNPPPQLLDPTNYLSAAAAADELPTEVAQNLPKTKPTTDVPEIPDETILPTLPKTKPTTPAVATASGLGFGLLALLALLAFGGRR